MPGRATTSPLVRRIAGACLAGAFVAGVVVAATQSPTSPRLAGEAPAAAAQPPPGVAILQVDTDRRLGTIDQRIYGQFLEEINHSVVDGLFAEQIRGAGFEGKDFETYWTSFGPAGAARAGGAPLDPATKNVRGTTA